MIYLTSCCSCIELRKGCIIIAVLQIILGIIIYIDASYIPAAMRIQIIHYFNPYSVMYAVAEILTIVCHLHLLYGGMLFIGVYQKYIEYILNWLKVMVLIMTIAIICLIIAMARTVCAGGKILEIVLDITIDLVITGLEVYIVMIVFSFYKTLKGDNNNDIIEEGQ